MLQNVDKLDFSGDKLSWIVYPKSNWFLSNTNKKQLRTTFALIHSLSKVECVKKVLDLLSRAEHMTTQYPQTIIQQFLF